MLLDARLGPNEMRLAAVVAAWANLITVGTTLTAAERIVTIGAARAAWAGEPAPDPTAGLLGEAAHWLAIDAGGLTSDVVDDLEARGLDRFRYLEAVGVVSMLSNIDFYARGLGASLPEPPDPDDRAPTGAVEPTATLAHGWVPSVGRPFAPLWLDALPTDGEALRTLHQPMYMPFDQMGDSRYRDDLARPQIEYLAARTSYLNECFY